MIENICVLAVGGAIDAKTYDYVLNRVIAFNPPAINAILEIVRVKRSSVTVTPFQKDSGAMTNKDRQCISAYCRTSLTKSILITHGMDTMIDTGLVLARDEALKNKTIVLTGALPYADHPVHAAANVMSAVTACRLLPPGVYIVTSGEIVPVEKAKKTKRGKLTVFVEREQA